MDFAMLKFYNFFFTTTQLIFAFFSHLMSFNSCININLDDIKNSTTDFFLNNVTFLSINVRSLRGKVSELLHFLDVFSSSFMFICLTEVCLDPSSDLNFVIPTYNSFKCLRNSRGGGIITFVHQSIKADIIEEKSGILASHESLLLKCKVPIFGELFLWTIYRPPNKSKNTFFMYLDNSLRFFHEKKLVLTGDININILSTNTNDIRFTNLMHSFSLHCHIDKPTFATTNANVDEPITSCLDHFWHNLNVSTSSYIIYPPFSDHMAIVLCVHKKISQPLKRIEFRNFSIMNKNNFFGAIEDDSYNFTISDTNVDGQFTNFFNWFKSLIDRFFPLCKKTLSQKRARTPWITSRIKRCIDKKHLWFKLYMAKLITYSSYRNYCNKLRFLLRCAEA